MSITLNGPSNFGMLPKIWYLNCKPQNLLNYWSPTNDLYRVGKNKLGLSIWFLNRSLGEIDDMVPIFFPLLTLNGPRTLRIHPKIWCFNFKLLRRTGSELCAKTLHASCLWLQFSLFQTMLRPLQPNLDTSGIKPHTESGKPKSCTQF